MLCPKHSYDILSEIEFPWPIAEIVLQHHERIDGSGYPYGLTGEYLFLEAKIIADLALLEIKQNRGILYTRM